MTGPHPRRRGYGFRRVSSLVAANASVGVCGASIFDMQDEESMRILWHSRADFHDKRQSPGDPPTTDPPPTPGSTEAPSAFVLFTDFSASTTPTPTPTTPTSLPPHTSQNATSSRSSTVSISTSSVSLFAQPSPSDIAIPTPSVSSLPAHRLLNLPLPSKYGIPILAVAGVVILAALIWLVHTCVTRYQRRKFRRAEKLYRRDPWHRIALDGDGFVGGPRYVGISGEEGTSQPKGPYGDPEKDGTVSGYRQLSRGPLDDDEAFEWPGIADEEKDMFLYNHLRSNSGAHSHSRDQLSHPRLPQPSLLNPNRSTSRHQSIPQPFPQPPTLHDRDNTWSNGTRSTVRIVQSRKGEEEDDDDYYRYASDSTSVALFALYQDDSASPTRKPSVLGGRGHHSHNSRSQYPRKGKGTTNNHTRDDHPAYHRIEGGVHDEDRDIMPWERLRHKSIKRVILENAKKEKRWIDSLRGRSESTLITGEDNWILIRNQEGGATLGAGSARRKGVRPRHDDGPLDGDACSLGDTIPTTLQELEAWDGVSAVGRNEKSDDERGTRRRSYGRTNSNAHVAQVPSSLITGPATLTQTNYSGSPSKARRSKRNGWIQVQEDEHQFTNGEEDVCLDKDALWSLFMSSGIPIPLSTQPSRPRTSPSRAPSSAPPPRPPSTATRQKSHKNLPDSNSRSTSRARSRSTHASRSGRPEVSLDDASSEGGFKIISESPILTPLFSEPEHAIESGPDTRPVEGRSHRRARKSAGAVTTLRSCSTPHNPAAPSEKPKSEQDKYTALPARGNRRRRSNASASCSQSSVANGKQEEVNKRVTEQINRRRTKNSGIPIAVHHREPDRGKVMKTAHPLRVETHHSSISNKKGSRHHTPTITKSTPLSKPKSALPAARPARSKIISRDVLPLSPPQLMSPPLQEILFFTPRPDSHSPQPQTGAGGFWGGPGNLESLPTFSSALDVAHYDAPPPLPNLHIPNRASAKVKAVAKKAKESGIGTRARMLSTQPHHQSRGVETKKLYKTKDQKSEVSGMEKKVSTKTSGHPTIMTPPRARTKPSSTPRSYLTPSKKTPSRPPLNPSTSSYYASSVSVYTSATAPIEHA